MTPADKKLNHIEISMSKIGMGNRELLMVLVLRAIANGYQTAKEIFEEVMPYYPGRSRSMAFLYETLKELEKEQLITSSKDGRTSLYSVTKAGIDSFWSQHEEMCQAVYQISSYLHAKLSHEPAPPIQITKEQEKFFNRFINVRELVSTIFLGELSRRKRLTGKQLMEIIHYDYSWYCSKGYLYEILHSLMEAGLVEGEWDHPIKRNVLTYQINALGIDLYPGELQKTIDKLRETSQFMKNLSLYLKTERHEDKGKPE
ncbi:PadR family transcriptional regulator [Brevibacillus choshinensis]|uniref:PadR family transcriptional regulator n=1 Tax=Brevibacillus choshinensis TaxID=54911 RepID=UPI002E1D6533|nr:PadR family transcriptional regulator [Brevibacillus choshinensis]